MVLISKAKLALRAKRKRTLALLASSLVVAAAMMLFLMCWHTTLDTTVDSTATLLGLTRKPALLPIDLSVNNLQLISRAPGALSQQVSADEDFLPIVSSVPQFRFRLKPMVGAPHFAIQDILAYQIEAFDAHSKLLWDSGKVNSGLPTSIPWGGNDLQVGSVIKWRVQVWDYNGVPSTSAFTKFAVGPFDDWKGQWITHPTDLHAFQRETNLWRHGVNYEQCENWEKRRDLPIMRSKFTLAPKKQVLSALLVVSGLGSFHAMLNGKPLSSSSVLDPPLTDFTERVSYRGYDVTKLLSSTTTNVVSILLGSAWWDSRPLTCCIVSINLLPRGSLTCIAQLHVEYTDGTRDTLIPTSPQNWETRRGYLRDSDLFTGESIDLQMKHGWNTINDNGWISPVVYKSPISHKQWRQDLSERSNAKPHQENENDQLHFTVAPIGKLVPVEAPPVMPIERIPVESIVNLGSGRWLYDFGKGMSGVLRFDQGLPVPIVPKHGYPRGHSVLTRSENESFVTVVYGDSLELETGDVNLNLVAGMGLREKGHDDVPGMAGPCFPKDHGKSLLQRDVYIASSSSRFKDARQPLFTSHGFRFAEVCCTEEPPSNVHAVAYRTAFSEWGKFDSSNVLLNGAYEMTRNALNSNMLGTQTDCPHREKLQYGGDLVADSPAAMHFFDLSAFYGKIIHDWMDTQWDNGAYTETSTWQELNDYAGIGHGAGETVWASLPAVLMVRHFQQYGDLTLAKESFAYHVKWLEFLKANWEQGMKMLFYDRVGRNLENYNGNDGGLGDWLSLLSRDTYLTHNSFFMATARCVAYLANKIGNFEMKTRSLALATEIKNKINSLYMRRDDDGFRIKTSLDLTPGPELGLFARIVPGKRRCSAMREWIKIQTNEKFVFGMSTEEREFFKHLNKKDLEDLERSGIVRRGRGNRVHGVWKRGHNMPEGILAVRYNLKALTEFGFHHVALNKVSGIGYPSYEYMMSHNATTLWETWFRSEDIFSRDHPMLGAVAEWLPSSVAGVSVDPKAVGGKQILFWPRIPTSASVVQYASATQGTKRGDASIAWKFLNLPKSAKMLSSAIVKVHIRVLVPPSSTARMMLPNARNATVTIKYAQTIPHLELSKSSAEANCEESRKLRNGFSYNWEFSPSRNEWSKVNRKKAIGTPCESFMFDSHIEATSWSPSESIPLEREANTELSLDPGLYDFVIDKWQLMNDIEAENESVSYCSDPHTAIWDIQDAIHII